MRVRTELVLHGSSWFVDRIPLFMDCQMFLRHPGLLEGPYHVQSNVSPASFQHFVDVVQGADAAIDSKNAADLILLCAEFEYEKLEARLAEFEPYEAAVLHARRALPGGVRVLLDELQRDFPASKGLGDSLALEFSISLDSLRSLLMRPPPPDVALPPPPPVEAPSLLPRPPPGDVALPPPPPVEARSLLPREVPIQSVFERLLRPRPGFLGWDSEVELLQEEAGRGDADSEFRLGVCLEVGLGIERDLKQASEL
jgi:hypothetical protein